MVLQSVAQEASPRFVVVDEKNAADHRPSTTSTASSGERGGAVCTGAMAVECADPRSKRPDAVLIQVKIQAGRHAAATSDSKPARSFTRTAWPPTNATIFRAARRRAALLTASADKPRY